MRFTWAASKGRFNSQYSMRPGDRKRSVVLLKYLLSLAKRAAGILTSHRSRPILTSEGPKPKP